MEFQCDATEASPARSKAAAPSLIISEGENGIEAGLASCFYI